MATSQRKIVIPGGAGYLGRCLSEHFLRHNDQVVILSRCAGNEQVSACHVLWDGETLADWAQEFEGADAVINLAGRSVNCRYTKPNRREIYDSRLRSTRIIGEAIAQCASPPKVWINSSSATIYRHALDRPMDEKSGELGEGFSVDVCRKWERTFFDAITPQTRKIALRSAMVFGKGSGGVMEAFSHIVRLGLGGTLGDGKQFVSWIHEEDFTRTVQWVIENDDLDGAINCASPNPIPNVEFMRTFREVCGQPIGLPATRWMLEIGAFFLRTETELLLKSRRVVPTRLIESGFHFNHPEWREALRTILFQKPYSL